MPLLLFLNESLSNRGHFSFFFLNEVKGNKQVPVGLIGTGREGGRENRGEGLRRGGNTPR